MSTEALTQDQFLLMKKPDIDKMFDEELPPVTDEDTFSPAPYDPLTNESLKTMKDWKIAYMEKANERRTILNWIVPVLLVGPVLVTILLAGTITFWTALFATVDTMIIVGVLWIFGKKWGWEKKKYATNVDLAEQAIVKVRNRRAAAWAAARYDLKEQFVEWAEFSNFYIEGKGYRWKAVEEGRFVVADADTGEELPRLEEAE